MHFSLALIFQTKALGIYVAQLINIRITLLSKNARCQ
nr:MAG TPA: hypothetical protein [Caudoviricetes sp.]